MIITSTSDMNEIIFRYLLEMGYYHTSFVFSHEAMVNDKKRSVCGGGKEFVDMCCGGVKNDGVGNGFCGGFVDNVVDMDESGCNHFGKEEENRCKKESLLDDTKLAVNNIEKNGKSKNYNFRKEENKCKKESLLDDTKLAVNNIEKNGKSENYNFRKEENRCKKESLLDDTKLAVNNIEKNGKSENYNFRKEENGCKNESSHINDVNIEKNGKSKINNFRKEENRCKNESLFDDVNIEKNGKSENYNFRKEENRCKNESLFDDGIKLDVNKVDYIPTISLIDIFEKGMKYIYVETHSIDGNLIDCGNDFSIWGHKCDYFINDDSKSGDSTILEHIGMHNKSNDNHGIFNNINNCSDKNNILNNINDCDDNFNNKEENIDNNNVSSRGNTTLNKRNDINFNRNDFSTKDSIIIQNNVEIYGDRNNNHVSFKDNSFKDECSINDNHILPSNTILDSSIVNALNNSHKDNNSKTRSKNNENINKRKNPLKEREKINVDGLFLRKKRTYRRNKGFENINDSNVDNINNNTPYNNIDQGNIYQDNTNLSNIDHNNIDQDNRYHNNIDQDNTKQSNIKQSNIDKSNINHNNIDKNNINQNNIDQDNRYHNNIDQDNTKQSNIYQNNTNLSNIDHNNRYQDNRYHNNINQDRMINTNLDIINDNIKINNNSNNIDNNISSHNNINSNEYLYRQNSTVVASKIIYNPRKKEESNRIMKSSLIHSLKSHPSPSPNLKFYDYRLNNGKSNILSTASTNGTVKIFIDFILSYETDLKDEVTCMEWISDNVLYVGLYNGNIARINKNSNGEWSVKKRMIHSGPVFSMDYIRNNSSIDGKGSLLTVGFDGKATLSSGSIKETTSVLKIYSKPILDCSWIDNKSFVTCGSDFDIGIIRLEEDIGKISDKDNKNTIKAHNINDIHTINVQNNNTSNNETQIITTVEYLKGHINTVNKVSCINDIVASSSDDTYCMLWNLSHEKSVSLNGHTKSVISHAWMGEDNISKEYSIGNNNIPLASIGTDYKLIIWNTEIAIKNNTYTHPKQIHTIDYNHKLGIIATGGCDGIVRLWDTRMEKEAHYINLSINETNTKIIDHVEFSEYKNNDVCLGTAFYNGDPSIIDLRYI